VPVVNLNRYTDPITGAVEYADALPQGWFYIEGECFSPAAQVPLAQYVVDHPTIGFRDLVASLTAHPAAAARAINTSGPLPKGSPA
jgi:hypothetical protein